MKKITKLALLVATVFPFIYFAWVYVNISALVQQRAGADIFDRIFVAHIFIMLLTVGLLGFYLVHLYRNNRVHGNSKMLWTLALLFASFLAMVVYWGVHIWPIKERKLKPTPTREG